MTEKNSNELAPEARVELLRILEARFEDNMHRHPDATWAEVRARLDAQPGKLWSLGEMERTGGEPDVVGRDEAGGAWLFADCSVQSPEGRRSVCYDREALESRKKHKPEASAVELAQAVGATLLDIDRYRFLQEAIGPFDTSTSSWLLTPSDVRELGGAVFGDHRFGRTWIYHNGAESYYAARGFRCLLAV